MIMAVASPQVELLISLFFSEDDVNFSYVSYISTSGITTLHTQDIFLEKIKNHANNLIGDHTRMLTWLTQPFLCWSSSTDTNKVIVLSITIKIRQNALFLIFTEETRCTVHMLQSTCDARKA